MSEQTLISRRSFLTLAAGAAATAAVLGPSAVLGAGKGIPAPVLPYPQDALEPVISARTVEFHFGKHHQGYYANMMNSLEGIGWQGKSLEDVVKDSAATGVASVFNNAAQVFNHDFYWKSMKPGGTMIMRGGKLSRAIDGMYGSLDSFRKAFVDAAASLFGSGWIWLNWGGGMLRIEKGQNAANPLTTGDKPLLTLDVWEHAYYLDYQNRRKDYAEAWFDRLADWGFAEANMPG